MKRSLLPGLFLCLIVASAHAQQHDPPPPLPDRSEWAKDSIAPYQKYPTVPAFNIRLMDSVTIFNTYNIPKGKPVAIIIFDPDCKHCKHTIGNLVRNMDSVKNVQFYLVTPVHDMAKIRGFYDDYHMAQYENIRMVGRDYEFFCFTHYRPRAIPDIAIYDANKKLLKFIPNDFSATDIYNAVNNK